MKPNAVHRVKAFCSVKNKAKLNKKKIGCNYFILRSKKSASKIFEPNKISRQKLPTARLRAPGEARSFGKV